MVGFLAIHPWYHNTSHLERELELAENSAFLFSRHWDLRRFDRGEVMWC